MPSKKEAPQTEQLFPTENPTPDFSGVKDFPNAEVAHRDKDAAIREAFEKQGMGEGAADLGREAVRQAVVAVTQEAKRMTRAAQPERMPSRRAGYVDVSREAAQRKPGLPRLN